MTEHGEPPGPPAAGWSREPGADTPDAAANRFIDALEKNDVTWAAQFIVPDEAYGLAKLIEQSGDKVKEGNPGSAQEEHPKDLLAGVTVQTNGATTEVSDLPTPVDGVKMVEFTEGSVSATYDPSQVDPVTEDFILSIDGRPQDRELGGPEAESGTVGEARDEMGRNPYTVTVKQGDSWYVSPVYTVLAQAAQDAGVSMLTGAVTAAATRARRRRRRARSLAGRWACWA